MALEIRSNLHSNLIISDSEVPRKLKLREAGIEVKVLIKGRAPCVKLLRGSLVLPIISSRSSGKTKRNTVLHVQIQLIPLRYFILDLSVAQSDFMTGRRQTVLTRLEVESCPAQGVYARIRID